VTHPPHLGQQQGPLLASSCFDVLLMMVETNILLKTGVSIQQRGYFFAKHRPVSRQLPLQLLLRTRT
jgi:hypothetical protein